MSDIKKSRVISINDLLVWRKANKNGLTLSPKYQRNNVWNSTMKSYLLDSIIRGFPIPPVFIRQQIDPVLKQTYREVIDGQQRIRAILNFIDGEYAILKTHNKEYGNILFDDLPDDIKNELLSYEIQVELISEDDDSKIYDMFARLNTNNVALNRQELRNAKYWGEFKVFVYEYASTKTRDLFFKYGILSEKQITRMADTELLSSLIILLIDGVVTETQQIIDKYYEKYNIKFDNSEYIKAQLDFIFNFIADYYNYTGNNLVCFNRKTYFYTLFAFMAHQLYRLPNLNLPNFIKYSLDSISNNKQTMFNKLIDFENEFDANTSDGNKKTEMYENIVNFERYHRKRTTSMNERITRISILNNYFKE